MKQYEYMNSQNTAIHTHKNETITETLGSRWKSAATLARRYDKSRPWIYAVTDRFKIRSVSLGEPNKTGARLFDSQHFEEVIEALAVAQKDMPRINPRRKK